jgi:hypothetical protein
LSVTNVNGTKIRGTTTNDSAATGFVGEYVESLVTSNTNFPSTGTWGDLTSISLTAGDWDVSLVVYANNNGATVNGYDVGIGTATGNSSTGLSLGVNQVPTQGTTSAYDNHACIPCYRVSISATTTYYGKINGTFSVATPRFRCRLSARRVR